MDLPEDGFPELLTNILRHVRKPRYEPVEPLRRSNRIAYEVILVGPQEAGHNLILWVILAVTLMIHLLYAPKAMSADSSKAAHTCAAAD